MFDYGTLLLRFSAQGALVGVALFDGWLSLRALASVSYERISFLIQSYVVSYVDFDATCLTWTLAIR